MKEYIEAILHQNIQLIPYEEQHKLPLAYRNAYHLNRMIINGHEALLAAPVEKIPLATLRKQYRQMAVYTGLPCVLYLKETNYYSRDAMLEEGIPFVWEGHQIYLPYIGTLLEDQKRPALRNCNQISYLTQKLLLMALYEGWQRITVTKAAEMMGVSKMSITRCFDELEAMDIPYLMVRSRARSISADADKKAMWEKIKPILRNPIITTYALKEKPDIQLPIAGTMALAHYSMLDESNRPTYAVTKKNLSEIDLSAGRQTPAGEIPGCTIQELGYQIPFEDGSAVDPLTIVLGMGEEELSDPRVSMAIDEMLEEHVW